MMNRKIAAALGAFAMAVAFTATAFAQPGQVSSPVRVEKAARFARTMPLRDMQYLGLPPILRRAIGDRAVSAEQIARLREKLVKSGLLRPLGSKIVLPLERKKPALTDLRRVRDKALQTSIPKRQPDGFTTPGFGFDGLGNSTGTGSGFTPPDTNAAVGQNYIVEGVNVEFAVYDKTNGNMVMGPTQITNLWSSMGGDCLNDGVSDPVINYDQISHRWLISQITTNGSPNYHCIAISQTNDPTGAYYTYAFPITSGLPDYPKVAVWPGSYLATFNDFNPGFDGVDFVAYDATAMQNGDPNAQMVEFTESSNAYSDLPVEVDGADMPPAGAPALFVNYTSPNVYGSGAPYGLELWSMNVDWTNPSAATLTDNGNLAVDPFTDYVCGGNRTCIPQASSSQTLDAITDRLMYRAVYRNFGSHQAILAMHTVGADSSGNPPTGERWYELRSPAGSVDPTTWSVYQQGTYAPSDGNSRWMGSIAFDHVGNIAMGYSESGPSQDPEIAYTGRHAGDPLGQMTQAETVMQAAGGSDTGSYARWGDYTSMQIDPTDDCTFWYANEYFATTGDSFSWSTHIGSMKFANCSIGPQGTLSGTVTDASDGSPIANATVTINPGNITTETASDGTYSVQLPVGSYTVAASDFGYQPGNASVTITDGQTTTQNFQLTAAPSATLSGHVTDGSGHGYGLYAEVKVTAAGFGQVADVWTNPTTGAYSVKLPTGTTYSMTATTVLDGYNPGSATVTLSGDTTQDFALTVISACTAPGYGFQVGGLNQDFNGATFPPSGWSVTSAVSGAAVIWKLNTTWGYGNFTGGTGTSADADSNAAGPGSGNYDTSLVTPPIAVTSLAGSKLRYKANYIPLGGDALDLDISTDGGTTWTNISHWTTAHGTLLNTPGVDVSVDLSPYLPASGTFQLRWRYYSPPTGDWEWYAQIDDVSIGGCQPQSGGLVFGQVTDGNTLDGLVGATVADDVGDTTTTHSNPSDPNLPVGSYLFFVQSGNRTVTASDSGYADSSAQLTIADNSVTTQNFTLNAGKLSISPTSISQHVMVNTTATAGFAISNTGTGSAHYQLLPINATPPGTTPAKAQGPGAPLHLVNGYFSPLSLAALRKQGKRPTAQAGNSQRPAAGGPDTAAWTSVADMPVPIVDGCAATDPSSGKVYAIAGVSNGADITSSYVYDPSSDSWSTATGLPNGGLEKPACAVLNGKVYVTDGWDSGGNNSTTLFIYDPSTDTWSTGTDIPYSSGGAAAGVALDGKFYVIGGCQNGNSCPGDSTVEVYDPSTDSWSSAADYPTPSSWQACAGIGGKIYCAGGLTSGSSDTANGYMYDPSSDSWSPIAPIPYDNWGMASIGVATGQLLIQDGVTNGFSTTTNQGAMYDTSTNTWTALPNNVVTTYRSGSACGFYELGGMDSGNNFVGITAAEVLPGYSPCGIPPSIPWATAAPMSGTLAPGASANIGVTFNGAGQTEFTDSKAYFEVTNNTPYGAPNEALHVTWDPQPVALKTTVTASPNPVQAGQYLVFNIAVKNMVVAGDGAASGVTMSFTMPTGMTYVAENGPACTASSGTVSCDMGDMAQGDQEDITMVVQIASDFSQNYYSMTFGSTAREPQDSNYANTNSLLVTGAVKGTGPSGGGGGGSSVGGGGIGGFGWLGLVGLLGLATAGVWIRRRRTV